MHPRRLSATFTILLLLAPIPAGANGGLARITAIDISGLKYTQSRTVRRELPFREGDLWLPDDKGIAERRLRNLGLFSEVVVNPPNEEGIVLIHVHDRWPLFVLPEATRSDVGKSSAGFTLTDYNLWGLQHELRLAVREETGKNFSSLTGTTLSGGYLWRRIGDGPFSLSLSGNAGRRVFDAFENGLLVGQFKERNYGWRGGISVALGPVPGEGWDAGLGFASNTSKFRRINGKAPSGVEDRRRNSMQVDLSYNLVDDHITWLTGFRFNYAIDVAHAILGSTINVYRQNVAMSSHLPVPGTHNTFDFRVSGGGASGKVLQDGLFDIGGSRGLRGYLPGELQGTYYLYANLEGRFPVSRGGNFQLVGFTDLGQIWNRRRPALGKSLIVGMGGGARITLRWLVKGTFRSDIAYGMATHNWRVYFGTGQVF